MAGIDRLEEVEAFRPAQLAEDNAVGPHAQGGFEQQGGEAGAVTAALGDQGDGVGVGEQQLGRVFDGQQALGGVDEAEQRPREAGFAGRGAAGDQDVEAFGDGALKEGLELTRFCEIAQGGEALASLGVRVAACSIEEPEGRQLRSRLPEGAEGERGGALDRGRGGDLQAERTAEGGEAARDQRMPLAERVVRGAGEIARHGGLALGRQAQVERLHMGGAVLLDPGAAVGVDRDLGGGGIGDEFAQGREIMLGEGRGRVHQNTRSRFTMTEIRAPWST